MTDPITVPMTVPKLLYTPVEAANALGISRSSLYVLLADGHIDSVRIGGSRRIPDNALIAYIDQLADADGNALQDERG